jgi:hypothetical protein
MAIGDGKFIVLRGRAALGLGVDGASAEDREHANEMSRNRTKLIFARMEARRAGLDPDAVGRLEEAGIEMTHTSHPSSSSAYSSSGSSVRPSASLDSFSSNRAGGGGGGAGGGGGGGATAAPPGGSGGLASLSALVSRATGGGGATGLAGAASSRGATYGVVDHGDDDHIAPSRADAKNSAAGRSGARPEVELRAVQAPPKLSELLRGSRRGEGASSSPPPRTPAAGRPPGGSSSAATAAVTTGFAQL